MPSSLKAIGACALAILIALYIVGAVSHGSLRHEVQTLPLWFPIILGFNRKELARWCALGCMLIWLFLFGWSHILSGHFSPVEIAMTIVIGMASALGIVLSLRRIRWSLAGFALALLFAVFQVLVFRVSMLPAIAHQ
jgi:hypothetical protein